MGLRGNTFLLGLLLTFAPILAREGVVPSHDQALIDQLASHDAETRINAAVALAERKKNGTLNPHAEEELRELFIAQENGRFTTAADQREAIAMYYGEFVPLLNSGEWTWLVQHYTEEPDTGVRMMLAHSLGEIAQTHPENDPGGEAAIKRREIIWKAACANHLQDLQRHPSHR